MSPSTLPATMKALVIEEAGKPLQLKTIPVPTAVPGSVVVKVIATPVNAGLDHLLTGRIFTFPKDMIPGGKIIGRVVQTGPDTTSLTEGQLVLVDSFVRARDDPSVQILWGLFDGPSPASKKFAADNWAHGSFAEYARAPLENVYALDEKALLAGGLGYEPEDLIPLASQVVAYGGLRAINIQAGETVIVSPATGTFTGQAVQVAVAMGARVIAFSRNEAALKALQASQPAGRVEIVVNTGDVDKDAAALQAFGPVDAVLDISPIQAKDSTHVRSAIRAVRSYGRVALMGVLPADIAVPYAYAMYKNLTIRGQYMYEREDVRGLIKLAETGVLRLGKAGGTEVVGRFGLEKFNEAIALAAAHPTYSSHVVFKF